MLRAVYTMRPLLKGAPNPSSTLPQDQPIPEHSSGDPPEQAQAQVGALARGWDPQRMGGPLVGTLRPPFAHSSVDLQTHITPLIPSLKNSVRIDCVLPLSGLKQCKRLLL